MDKQPWTVETPQYARDTFAGMLTLPEDKFLVCLVVFLNCSMNSGRDINKITSCPEYVHIAVRMTESEFFNSTAFEYLVRDIKQAMRGGHEL